MTPDERRFIAYETHPQDDMPIVAPPVERDWMDRSIQRFAYRCLPLAIANRAGWMIRNPTTFMAVWNGGLNKQDVEIHFNPPPDPLAPFRASTTAAPAGPTPAPATDGRIISHFGSGVVTFSIPYLFRTPRSINLWVKGPTNYIKDGAQPLEGIVETDWGPSTFTMNWKLTRPRQPVVFRAGEPICMIVPVPRGLAEGLDPVRTPIEADPRTLEEYRAWERSRSQFLDGLRESDPETTRRGWQKDYFKGQTPTGEAVSDHQTRVNLKEFRRHDPRG